MRHLRPIRRLVAAAVASALLCVGAQGGTAPELVVGTYSSARTLYPLSTHKGLETWRDLLGDVYDLTFVEFDSLLDADLCTADLLFVNAWEVEPEAGEVVALEEYLEAGGTALLNAAWASSTVTTDEWLQPFGLQGARFLGGAHHAYMVPSSIDARAEALINGPFGEVTEFNNRFDSALEGIDGQTFADVGVIALATTAVSEEEGTLVLAPRDETRRGQALFIGNGHAVSDQEDFGGGFMHLVEHQRLLLNLVDSALQSSACVIDVTIEIKPESINLQANGKVKAVVFGTATFDVEDVDTTTVTLAGASVAPKGKNKLMTSIHDDDGDGYDDLTLHFPREDLELSVGDTSATLEGELFDGSEITGSDEIRIVK